VHHNGDQTPVHIKLNIDNDNGHSLEGTMKVYRTLDELLHYYETNPLSHGIRGLGAPVAPLDKQSETFSKSSAHFKGKEDISPLQMIQSMQKNFIEELGKQREEHRQQLEEERKLFREEIKKERQTHRDYLEGNERNDDALARTLQHQEQPPPAPAQEPQKKKGFCILS